MVMYNELQLMGVLCSFICPPPPPHLDHPVHAVKTAAPLWTHAVNKTITGVVMSPKGHCSTGALGCTEKTTAVHSGDKNPTLSSFIEFKVLIENIFQQCGTAIAGIAVTG